jgi:uncharacterized heparinase superfamily protein
MNRPPATVLAEYAKAASMMLVRQLDDEARAFALRRWALDRPRPKSLAATPRDFRPPDLETGRALLAGRVTLAGAVLETGVGGDPWDTPSPSRRFAEELHRFAWLPALTAQGPRGVREALRLIWDWEALFGRWNAFAWSADVQERRVFNLACALGPLLEAASDAETARLLASISRQARDLMTIRTGPIRAAERATVVATAAAALDPVAAAALLNQALDRAAEALDHAVLPDGGHRTRSPEVGLELLLDLLTLDDALNQRGRAAPAPVARSLDRLTSATRFFTLADSRLAAFQGGEAVEPARVRAARRPGEADAPTPIVELPHAAYQRLGGGRLQALVDVGVPPEDGWSVQATAQPGAFEAAVGRDRLIVNTGWSAQASGHASLREAAGGSTATLGASSEGRALTGFRADALGARLVGGAETARVQRQEQGDDALVELQHDGWLRSHGFHHERRLYLAAETDELRGEDRFTPQRPQGGPIPYGIRFHLHPDVRAAATRDGRSVTLQTPSGDGWSFRSDAAGLALEPSVVFQGGDPRRSQQIVLRGQVRPAEGARIRWKLSPADDR